MSENVSDLQLTTERPANQKPVGAVVAAIKVLRYLADTPQPVGVSQIAKDTDLYPSTCFNILRTLVQEDLVSLDSKAKTYRLGIGIIDFARGLLANGGLIPVIQDELYETAQRGGFSMTLWRRMPDHNVVVASAASGRVEQININIGSRLPTYVGATGRLVAAFERTPRAQLRNEFKRLRWEDAPEVDEYLRQVELTRARGWAIDVGNHRAGLITIATPVLDHSERVRMMVAAHMFRDQFTEQQRIEIANRLQEISERVRRAGSITNYD